MNAYVVAMDTAAVTLAALAAGLISAGGAALADPSPGWPARCRAGRKLMRASSI